MSNALLCQRESTLRKCTVDQSVRLQMISRQELPSGACASQPSGMCATACGLGQDVAQDIASADDGGAKPACTPGGVGEDKENQRPSLEAADGMASASAHDAASNHEPEHCPQTDNRPPVSACPPRATFDSTAFEPETPPVSSPAPEPSLGECSGAEGSTADLNGAVCRHLTESSSVSTAMPRSPLLDITRVSANLSSVPPQLPSSRPKKTILKNPETLANQKLPTSRYAYGHPSPPSPILGILSNIFVFLPLLFAFIHNMTCHVQPKMVL
jgi:hypothetical protein